MKAVDISQWLPERMRVTHECSATLAKNKLKISNTFNDFGPVRYFRYPMLSRFNLLVLMAYRDLKQTWAVVTPKWYGVQSRKVPRITNTQSRCLSMHNTTGKADCRPRQNNLRGVVINVSLKLGGLLISFRTSFSSWAATHVQYADIWMNSLAN